MNYKRWKFIYGLVLLENFEFLQEFSFSALLSNLHEIVFAFPIVFFILGVVYCFYGREIFDILNFLIGGFAGMAFALGLSGLSGLGLILIAMVAFVVGGLIGWFVPYLLVGIIGFSIGLGLFVGVSFLVGLIFGVIVAVVAVALFIFFLPVLTSLLGGSLAAYAVFDWTGSEPISVVVGVVLIVAGIAYQYTYGKSKEQKEKTKEQEEKELENTDSDKSRRNND